MPEKIRLMLIDDHTVVRSGLRALFDRQPDMSVVAESDAVGGAPALLERERPDVLVLDLTLAGGGSMELIKSLHDRGSPVRVLVLTMHDDPAYARAALAAGAGGYMVKTVSEAVLIAAIRAVCRGQVVVDLDDAEKTARVFGPHAAGRRTVPALSDRELEVLRLLGRGFANQEVAEQLDISPKTVATYRARIGEKLGLHTTADFVRYATDTGLLGPPDRAS